MEFIDLAGLGGIGFVLVGVVINAVYLRSGLPLPTSGKGLDATTDSFDGIANALKRPSVLVPVTWLGLTLFAAGLLSVLWRGSPDQGAWALVGFAGVLLQNATFTCVEALRFGMATAARHGGGAMAGQWGMSNVLFGFNQVFLAMALLGFTVAGVSGGLVPVWQAWLGYVSAALLFLSSLAAPYNVEGGNRLGPAGLIGWLGWISWIVAYSVSLLLQ
ncbi:hypothetical protein [Nonomuraea rhizosphaerae]|uniref:hypothetical protein n=1 Tax=Nonomuraea rhizosphaerae TaxID=2665663 RepID=UPI001C5E0E23|nr:hypothetical protein [Nonomuraea rhizosphaerae]